MAVTSETMTVSGAACAGMPADRIRPDSSREIDRRVKAMSAS